MDADQFKAAIHPLLKGHGFRKCSATWRRRQEESIAVLNVKKSSWGGDNYYINLGTYFFALGSNPAPTENLCHVQVRLDVEAPEIVVANAVTWFKARSTFALASAFAEQDARKGLVFKELMGA